MPCCVIDSLKSASFSERSFGDKQSIIEGGRPRPTLKYLNTKTKSCTRRFRVEVYEKIAWLTGCQSSNKLYCWPCILFSKDRKSIWVDGGLCDLNNLHNYTKRHECSENHITSVIKLKTFGKSSVEFQLKEQLKLDVVRYNDRVTKNREILKRFIDISCFLGKQELAFRGLNKNADLSNAENYVELTNLLCSYDEKLKNHMESSTVFSELSNHIQNNLIESIGENILNEILKEIAQSPFVSIILDESTDISNESQLTTVLQYSDGNGSFVERVLGFSDVSSDQSAGALFQHIMKVLEKFKCSEKLVAYTYDGATVMSGETGLQKQMKEVYPDAVFVHCYAHQLNFLMSQALGCIKECKIFFSIINGLFSYFHESTKRSHAFDKIVQQRLSKMDLTFWKFQGQTVETVYEHLDDLKTFFKHILESPKDWDSSTIILAKGFASHLEEFDFLFMLNVLNVIFTYSTMLSAILQTNIYDIKYCKNSVIELKKEIKNKRNEFEIIWSKLEANPPYPQINEQEQTDSKIDLKSKYQKLYSEIFDNISDHISSRFRDYHKIIFFELLDAEKKTIFQSNFPELSFSNLKESYTKQFDFIRLKSELKVLYASDEFNFKTVYELSGLLKNNDIDEAMPELSKLCKLICCIPTTKASAERSFSALKRVKSYLRSTQSQNRLSKLSLIAIEKELLGKIKNQPDFYDNVIDLYAKREKRIDLIYE